jgi:hypothetical protein
MSAYPRMNPLVRACILTAWLLPTISFSQEDGGATVSNVAIIGPLADGTPSPPAPAKVLPDFTIQNTDTHRLADHKVIMHRVADPGLPDPPAPPQPMSREELEALRASPEWQAALAEHKETKLCLVSATVYDHERTLVRWYGNGTPGKTFSF